MKKVRVFSVLALMLAFSLAEGAMAQVTLPDTGIDVTDFITAAITAMGPILGAMVGGYFAFLLIAAGIKWAKKAFASK